MKSGVYKIINLVNKDFYIGSSVDINKRWIHHFSYLRRRKHHNPRLQKSFNKYGQDSFLCGVIEYCEIKKLQKREQYWIDQLFNKNCFNAFKQAYSVTGENHPMFGKKHSPESIAKIKLARSKQVIKHSEETKRKIGRKGRPVNMDHIRKMVEVRKRKPVWNKGLKLPSIYRIRFPDCIIKQLVYEYNSGASMEWLRKKYNTSWDTIKRILTQNKIQTRNISQQINHAKTKTQ